MRQRHNWPTFTPPRWSEIPPPLTQQRSWLNHVEACTAGGMSMKAYAERKPTPRAALCDRLDIALVAGVDPSRSYVCAYVRRQFSAPVFDCCGDAAEVERHGEGGDCRRGSAAWREYLGGGTAARDQTEPSVPLAEAGPRSADPSSRFHACHPGFATGVFGADSAGSLAGAKVAPAGGVAGCGRREA